MMQHRRRLLTTRGAGTFTLAALIAAATWTGCGDDEGGTGFTPVDDDAGGSGGTGGVVEEFPCGIDCSTIQQGACFEARCNEETLLCETVPSSDVPCDDGLFCTVGDTCVEGVCTGQGENDCQLDPPSWTCQGVTCDEGTKSCSQVPLPQGSDCIASDPCIVGAICDANNLCTGPVNDCFFSPTPDQCHVSVCNSSSGECEPVPGNDSYACLDSLCSQGGSCLNGSCLGAIAKDCTFVGDDCNAGSCEMSSGACVQTAINEAGSCLDADGCTGGDTCSTGVCVPGAAIATCTDDDGCCGPTCTSANDNDCQSILLFGDDLPISGWDAYRHALTSAGRQWDESNFDFPLSNQGTFPDATALLNYDTLIIVAESYSDWPDDANLSVVTWLQEAGERNLLIIGRDLIQDFSSAAAASGEFLLYNLLGVTYLGPAAGTNVQSMLGVQSDPITDTFFTTALRLAQDTSSSGDYANPALGPATHIGTYFGGSGSGLTNSAMARYAPSYQTVWIGFNMHSGMVEREQRNELMRNILEWFKL